jgi:hypothetical protein
VGNGRYVNTYDANGNLTENIEYEWNSASNDWMRTRRYVNTYDVNGNLTESIDYFWRSASNDWIKYSWYVNTYDVNGNLAEHCGYLWLPVSKVWMGTQRYVDTYDANGNLTEHIDYEWNSVYKVWMGTRRYVDTYDANVNLTEHIEYEWNSETNEWIFVDKYCAYWWLALATKIHTGGECQKCFIYPNPTSDFANIETDDLKTYTIEIHSLNGQLLQSTQMEGPTHQIDLSSFEKGLYFITVRSEDFVRTEKIIKL